MAKSENEEVHTDRLRFLYVRMVTNSDYDRQRTYAPEKKSGEKWSTVSKVQGESAVTAPHRVIVSHNNRPVVSLPIIWLVKAR